MNSIITGQTGFSARLFAGLTMVSMLLSAFPVAFFVAQASTGISGDSFTINGTDTTYTKTADTTGLANIVLTFDYDLTTLDNNNPNVVISYSAGSKSGSVDVSGVDAGGDTSADTGTVTLAGLAVDTALPISITAADVSDFAGDDSVVLSNITVTGTALPLPPTVPTGTGSVLNVNDQILFDTIQEAIDAVTTGNGETIALTADILVDTETKLAKEITFEGNDYTITPTYDENDGNNSVLEVAANDNITIQNVTIDNTTTNSLHGINLYVANGIVIQNVTINGNGNNKSGVVVNGSEAIIRDIETSNSGWHAINVDITASAIKDGATATELTVFNTNVHGETTPPHIFVDDVTKPFTVNDEDSQYSSEDIDFRGGVARVYNLKTEPDFEPLQLTSICSVDGGGMQFRIQNTNNFPITATYEVVGATDTATVEVAAAGAGVIKFEGATDGADYTFFTTAEVTEAGTTILNYLVDGEDYTTTKAANDIRCPDPEPEPEPVEPPAICSIAGEVVAITENAVKFNGQPVDSNRRTLSGLNSVSSYANFFGKEGNGWSPGDFLTLGVEGSVTYKFTGKVALDTAGDDIAIWETTGGNTTQLSRARAQVEVSQDGVTFYDLGIITGDAALDIAPSGLSYVQYVRLTDDSAAIGSADAGDGFDVDAITIIEGSCDDYVRVQTTKIVCDLESELPNWGEGSADITANTAATWMSENEGSSCKLVSDWEFEWADQTASNPGNDHVGSGGSDWTAFSGSTVVPLAAVNSKSFWVREVLPEGYIPFAGGRNNDVSAELYCHRDVLNYDNIDRIDNPKVDETYHCVAWNVPKELPPQQCTIVSDENTLVDTNQTAVSTHVHGSWTTDIDGATWVWSTAQVTTPAESETRIFTETFTVDNPLAATLQVAADNLLLVKVNGDTVLDQTDQNNFVSVQTVDIASALNATGENVITFEVTNNAGVDNWRSNPAGVLYRLDIESAVACEVTTTPATSSLTIDNPAVNGSVLVGSHTFAATYKDFDADVDEVFWSIRADNCNSANHVVGNVPGLTQGASTFDSVTGAFAATVDMSTWTNGQYCLVVNPREDAGAPDERETRLFTLENEVVTNPENPTTFRISGVKWDDVNGDGLIDQSIETPEATLNGWTIFLAESGSGAAPQEVMTSGAGEYFFEVGPGTWIVTEETRDDWIQTGQYMNGDAVSTESNDFGSCVFTIAEDAVVEFYTCSFGNQERVDETENPPEPTRRSSSGGGSTRIERVAQPTPLVLGATTDAPQFCPFLFDFMQMGAENDATEVMKLQLFLNVFRSVYGGVENPVTGTFGVTTDANVKTFQEFYRSDVLDPWYNQGIVPHNRPTGFVYKTTLWKINSMVCPATAILPDFTDETLDANIDKDVVGILD